MIHQLSPETAALPPNGIREIVDLALAHPAGEIARLEQGEPSFAIAPHVREAAFRAIDDGIGYTQSVGTTPLRLAIVDRLQASYNMDIDVRNVVVTQGAVEAIFMALSAVVRAGDEVLVPDPAWPTYEMQVIALGGRPIHYGLPAHANFLPQPDEIESLITSRTRAIIINSPSNPTGSVMDAQLTERIVAIAVEHNFLVISDEVYDEIIFDGEHVTARQFAPQSVVSVFSLSKTHSMTGWRVGYAVVPDWMSVPATRIQETVLSCISGVSQAAAIAAITGDQSHVRSNLESYRARRDLALKQFEEGGTPLIAPRGAFYLMAPLSSGVDARRAALELLDFGVAVAPGTAFGSRAADMLRISLASSPETLRIGIGRIFEWSKATDGGSIPLRI